MRREAHEHWNTLTASLLVATSAHANHYDPASGESPATLMAVPADGIAYYRARVQAKRLWRDKKYAEAEPILERHHPRLSRAIPGTG
jgi:hypothetical protein